MSRRPPNVIVFFTDQQRHDTTGVHGCPLGLTPNFDRMARSGTHLVNNFTVQPVCAPARACLQTGLYATQHGVWCNGRELSAGVPTLAEHFNAAGYHTGYIGKWHLAKPANRGAVPKAERGGYQSWLAANVLECVSDAYDTHLWDENGVDHKLPGYRVDALTDAAIRHVEQHREHPFFLFLSHLEPHHQNHGDYYPAPEGYEQNYTGSWMPPDLVALGGTAPQHWPGYCGMVKRLDESLGRLLDALRSLELLDNTVVLFTSDHGNHFKTRNQEYKRSCHEASIRTPAALCGPGFDGGGAFTGLTCTVDLTATLLDAAGIAASPQAMGRPVGPALRERTKDTSWPDDLLVQISESETGRAVRTSRWKYSVRASNHGTGQKEMAGAAEYQDSLLYDLSVDPWELTNLIGIPSFAGVVAELRQRLLKRMSAIGETTPSIVDAPSTFSEQRRPSFPGGDE